MTLFAGAARFDITPTKPMALFGYSKVPRVLSGIHDPLFSTALYLTNGSVELIMISVDLLMLSTRFLDECRQEISNKMKIPVSNIIISTTHTHSGPVCMDIFAFSKNQFVPPADQEYLEVIRFAIHRCAILAKESAEPSCLAFTTAMVQGVGGNRNDPFGPDDPQASLLIIKRQPSNLPLALSIIYSMHPTVLHEDSTLVSADFPGYTRLALEKAHPGLLILYHTGPAGNLSPRYHVSSHTFSESERLGLILASAIEKALVNLEEVHFKNDIQLAAAISKVSLPRRKFPSSAIAQARLNKAQHKYQVLLRKNAPHGPTRTAEVNVFGAEEALYFSIAQESGELGKIFEQYNKAEVQVFQINNWAIVALPGELYVEYALQIKHLSHLPTAVISLANGELQGYIVTPGSKGYEASFSIFQPSAGKRMVDRAVLMINHSKKPL